MARPAPPRSTRIAALLAAALLAAACGARKPVEAVVPEPQAAVPPPPAAAEPPPGPVAEPDPPADPSPLYDRLDDAVQRYREGLEAVSSGDEVAGEEVLARAAEDLSRTAEECDRTAGCEMERFLGAFDLLLSDHGIALKRLASRVEEMETSIAVEEEEAEREPGTSPFVAAIPEVGQAAALLNGRDLGQIVTLNAPVKAALDDWLTWMRPNLVEAWEHYQVLREEIAPIYEGAGLPEALLYGMIATESGGKVHAHSRAGAAGLLQFMRRTGQIYGLGVQNGFDMRLDPAAATRANVAYLRDRFEELNDDLEKALAAYNGGEGRMRVLERKYQGASLWDKRVYYALPRETREYVPRVLAAAWLFLHPGDYNLEWPQVETVRATLVVRDEISLAELSICLGQAGNPKGWFRTLRNLNPRLDPGERVETGTVIVVPASLVAVYEQRCLEGDLLTRARELHDASYPERPEFVAYVVRRGDTLSKIAARHRCSMRQIAELNNLRPPRYVIHPGQELKIPDCG